MAIPSSGAIQLNRDIGLELGVSAGAETGLETASRGTYATINTSSASYPDGVPPHAMSEFYSYDHSAGVSVGSYGNGANNILWAGNQGTGLETDTVDISGANWCGSSVIGHTGHIYYRIKSGTSYRQDAQIYQVDYSGYGWSSVGATSGTYGYANWKGTRQTTNETYNHSSGWYTIASGSTSGRWNRDTLGTPSSNTGVSLTNHIYYEGSGSGAYNKDVYLRSPEITFNTDTIATKSYGYGADMGTLYMGVYITG